MSALFDYRDGAWGLTTPRAAGVTSKKIFDQSNCDVHPPQRMGPGLHLFPPQDKQVLHVPKPIPAALRLLPAHGGIHSPPAVPMASHCAGPMSLLRRSGEEIGCDAFLSDKDAASSSSPALAAGTLPPFRVAATRAGEEDDASSCAPVQDERWRTRTLASLYESKAAAVFVHKRDSTKTIRRAVFINNNRGCEEIFFSRPHFSWPRRRRRGLSRREAVVGDIRPTLLLKVSIPKTRTDNVRLLFRLDCGFF